MKSSARFNTAAAIAALNKRLNLTPDPKHQVWELGVSDVNRIDEFIETYPKLTDEDERFTLMSLIGFTYNDFLTSGLAADFQHVRQVEAKLYEYFKGDWPLLGYIASRWEVPGETDSEYLFAATPFMRSLINELPHGSD